MKRGTRISAPVSSVAGFVAFVAVSPLSPGSVYVTLRTVFTGISAVRIASVAASIDTCTLSPSLRNCTAFDDNNCEAFEMFTINEPEDLDVTAEVHDVSCYGRSDGRVYAYAIGGTAPYAYLWSGNMLSSNPYIEDIKGGTYSLLVTDGNGCSIHKTIAVREPDSLSVQITSEKEDPEFDRWCDAVIAAEEEAKQKVREKMGL